MPTPAQGYQKLVKEYQTAIVEYQKALKEAKTQPDHAKRFKETYPQPDKYAPRFLDLAEKHPKDPAALDALIWVVSHATMVDLRAKAIQALLRDHVESEKMADVCRAVGHAPSDERSTPLLFAVLEGNRHRTARAYACAVLADQSEGRLRLAREFQDQPESATQYQGPLGKGLVEQLVKADPDKLSKEAESFYHRIVKDFADVSDGQGGTLGQLAEVRIEALRNPILVGKPAGEIEGEDIDGKRFKLSDYRGKVVLLDFWGNW
jgi:hypothetical protein